MNRTWVLDLPYKKISGKKGVVHPVPPLTQNTRMNRHAERRLRADIRSDAAVLARVARLPKGLAAVRITLRWIPRVVRARDADNPWPTVKPLIDGLVDYGLVADDNIDVVLSAVFIGPADPKRPALQLVIEEISPADLGADPLPQVSTTTPQ